MLAVLCANILLALSLFLINSWSFRNGFVEYINQAEVQKLDPFVQRLSEMYITENGWDWVKSDHARWKKLIQRFVLRERPGRFRSGNGHEDRHRSDRGFLSIDPFLLLSDNNKSLILGKIRDSGKIRWKPIEANSETVGYLGYRPRTKLSHQLDRIFSQQQQQSFAWAAMGLILISAIVALPLASRLVKPIVQLGDGAKKLSAGEYDQELQYRSKDELGDLAISFNHLARTLKKNLQSRQQWIADISHELRTPVAVLQGEIESLQDGIRTVTPETLESLHSETLRISRLIDDLHTLTLSDQGALSYRMKEVDVLQIITACIQTHSAAIEQSGLTVSKRIEIESPQLIGDEQRLSQLFSNLLQNSMRYTDRGGTIEILVQHQNNKLVIQWSDSEPGVDDKHLPKLFDRLYRANQSRNRETGGSGLGLSICKSIIEAHGGTIDARHAKLGGLQITIELTRG